MERFGSRVHATGSELGFQLDRPFYWRVAEGLLYGEMPFNTAVRPPLLSEWESDRVRQFKNPRRRAIWMASRALAKALVRERFGFAGIVEIREGVDGEPLVYRDGMPMPEVWLGVSCRNGRIAAVVGDRPVSVDVRSCDGGELALGDRLMQRSELRAMRRVFRSTDTAAGVIRAIKESALRATRRGGAAGSLQDVQIDGDFSVQLRSGSESGNLHVYAVRIIDDVVITVVGRSIENERAVTRVVAEESALNEPAALQSMLERSVARARRMTEARARWHRLRWQGG